MIQTNPSQRHYCSDRRQAPRASSYVGIMAGDKLPAQTARFSVAAFIREAHFDKHRYITLILWLNCWKIRQISIGYAIYSV